jgi:hypothetical protein
VEERIPIRRESFPHISNDGKVENCATKPAKKFPPICESLSFLRS